MAKLWLDLGNTRLKYWLVDDVGQIIEADAKEHLLAPAELLMGLTDRIERYAPEFIGVSSVLGDAINANVADTLTGLSMPFEFVQVQSNHRLLVSRYDANQLGVDRWLQMLGAVDCRRRQCIVGCGTALTIDLIDHAEHLGGYIFPNLYLQRDALFSGTRQISSLLGQFDSIHVGVTTSEAVHRGVLLSVVGAVNEIHRRHTNYELIITGGDASLISPHLNQTAHVRHDLLLNGLMRFFG
ncbi:pantothenate kinase [Moraxella lincolnii]|uniref:pantothenate kinase n=1 Tax=Lwoffella lincolnii TaxID=90241 RepID=UPI0030D55752